MKKRKKQRRGTSSSNLLRRNRDGLLNEVCISLAACLFCGRVVRVSPGHEHECVLGGHACPDCTAVCTLGTCLAAK